MTHLFRATPTIKKIALANLLLLCLLSTAAQAKNNGVADYRKGMKILGKYQGGAFRWFLKSAQAGNAKGMYQLGRMYASDYGSRFPDSPNRYEPAVKWFKKAAALGNTPAMLQIANYYYLGIIDYFNGGNGNTKAQDFQLAKQWYEKAAEHGDPKGAANLAMIYQQGRLIPKDNVKALHWYKRAISLEILPTSLK